MLLDVIYSICFNICLLVVLAFMMTKMDFVQRLLLNEEGGSEEGRGESVWQRLWEKVLLGVIFGVFCIISDYIGIQVTGALPNARVIGVLSAGFLGGPVSGFITTVIAAAHRYLIFPETELTADEMKQLDEQGIWKERTSAERARIIEDNDEALKERIRMISNAKEEVILSTFDFRSDDSGKLMLGALIDAADRGVSVNVIVDGVSGFTKMKGNPDFKALASLDNVNVKIYNKVNPFKPWQSMGRLHDKYVIADRTNYILGGRNTFNYFLGAYPGHKNYDRDVLVACDNPDENSSVNDVLAYYESVWNYKESKAFLKNNRCAGNKKVRAARKELLDNYSIYYADNKDYLTDTDYTDETVEVSNIALLSNPIECGAKKPVVWYQLTKLMEQADTQVKIHTPYIICNEYMYDGLKKVCDSVENVSLMTNSVGNNGNPFGSADYYAHKDKVLGTGLEVWEYEGGYSYHGKSVLIDDDISVVGSFNIDMRSVYLDTELMLVIDSKEINEQLGGAMQTYEHSARKANADGTYDNPYNVQPVALTPKRERRMKLIKNFLLWTRYLF